MRHFMGGGCLLAAAAAAQMINSYMSGLDSEWGGRMKQMDTERHINLKTALT